MLDAAVLGEVENCILAECGSVEVAGVNQQFVFFGAGLDDDLAIRVDDESAADQRVAILDTALATHTTQVEFW